MKYTANSMRDGAWQEWDAQEWEDAPLEVDVLTTESRDVTDVTMSRPADSRFATPHCTSCLMRMLCTIHMMLYTVCC